MGTKNQKFKKGILDKKVCRIYDLIKRTENKQVSFNTRVAFGKVVSNTQNRKIAVLGLVTRATAFPYL
jgi:hypothetical protein